jgi:peptidoglycan hydrolase-like protein with peptidoglycan-binding domain
MNKKILNEIDQMKYLFGYQRGVVISEQKKVLNEGKIENIVKGLRDASLVWSGTKEQDFANNLRKISNWDEYNKVDELLRKSAMMGLSGLIFDEFDPGSKDDQYWLKEFDKHFKSIGLSTTFASGKQGKIQPPNQEVATPQNSPENTPGPGEPSGSAPAKPKQNAEKKEGWDEITKHYKCTPKTTESEYDDFIEISEYCQITHNGKDYYIYDIGTFSTVKHPRFMGHWSWKDDKPVLEFSYKSTKPATGFASGDEGVECRDEFCKNKKVAGRGATGECVKEIQNLLLKSGLVEGIQITKDLEACRSDVKSCDGIYGRETEKAVEKFQKETEIGVDGIVGCETWGNLFNAQQ